MFITPFRRMTVMKTTTASLQKKLRKRKLKKKKRKTKRRKLTTVKTIKKTLMYTRSLTICVRS